MKFNLKETKITQIVSDLSERKEALSALLDAIAETDVWEPHIEQRLDTIYRTRIRHLLEPRQHISLLTDFAYHLNIAASIVDFKSPSFAQNICVYETLVNDAIDEIESGWVTEVLNKTDVLRILKWFSNVQNESYTAELISIKLDLQLSYVINRLGIMESASLVRRRFEGENLFVSPTSLGLKHGIMASGPLDRIFNLGVSEHGPFFTRIGTDFRCLLKRQTGDLTLPREIFQDQNGIISRERIKVFGFSPILSRKGSFRLYVELILPTERLILGTWNDANSFKELDDWVSYANKQISEHNNDQGIKLHQRVVNKRTLDWVPGRSMTSADINFMKGAYERDWMNSTASSLCNYLNTDQGVVIDGNISSMIKPITPKKISWPKKQNWEYVFDKIFSPSDIDIFGMRQDIDLCFEFLYVDPVRSWKYDILKIGVLKSFTFIIHKRNDKFSELKQEIDKLSKNNGGYVSSKSGEPFLERVLGFEDFVSILFKIGKVDDFDNAWSIRTCNATTCNNIGRELLGSGRIVSRVWSQYEQSKDLLADMYEQSDSVVALCDNVIANDFIAHWEHQHEDEQDDLYTVAVEYPWPVEVGIGVPFMQAEWKAALYTAFYSAITSESRKSWEKTLEDLAKINVEVLNQYKLNSVTEGELHEHHA
ncbi:MAG: hypothetical protein AB2799_13875 [Candidatus Thiodiazotropha sp.]